MGWISPRIAEQIAHRIKDDDVFGVMDNWITWFVVNVRTGRTRRIGKIGSKRTNFYDKARRICDDYNEKNRRKLCL